MNTKKWEKKMKYCGHLLKQKPQEKQTVRQIAKKIGISIERDSQEKIDILTGKRMSEE